jgi:hypothetical protein
MLQNKAMQLYFNPLKLSVYLMCQPPEHYNISSVFPRELVHSCHMILTTCYRSPFLFDPTAPSGPWRLHSRRSH